MTDSIQTLPTFTEVRFVTKDGENISATKQNGVVTVVGDKNGTRQLPLNDFMQYMTENAQNLSLEKQPEKDEVAFKGNVNDYVHTYETKPTRGKKWLVGLASAFCPGAGQVINGQWGKGIGYFLGYCGLFWGGLVALLSPRSIKNPKLLLAGCIASVLGGIGLKISSIVNAVKNAKTTIRVVDEKGLMASEQ